MFVELGLAVGSVYLYNYLNAAEERKFKNSFNEVMLKTGIKNKDEETYRIYKIEPKGYGYVCYLNNVKGLSVEHLESKLNILECNLNSTVQIEKNTFQNYIKMYVVNKDLDKFMFEPVKCKSHQLYFGKDYKGQSYCIDLNKHPMLLIAGATGYGKSMLLACILTNLIYNSPKDIELYLTQLIKGEISSFADCGPVKMVAYNPAELMISINKVRMKMEERSNLFKAYGIRNIQQWNSYFPNRRMKRVILICEEMSELMELPVWEQIWKIAKAGRSVGVHLIGALQRTTATNLDTDVKSQMTRITFHQNSIIDSQNVINSNNAMKLKRGECIVCGNDGEIKIKVPYIDDDFVLLNKYVPEIRIPAEKEKQEILNVKKINNKIYSIEQPQIIDIEEDPIKPVEKKRMRKGVISLEDIENVNREG